MMRLMKIWRREHRADGDVARGIGNGIAQTLHKAPNTVPAMPAMPPVITTNISLRVRLAR